MTWKEFKDKVEAAGVRDDDLLSWIDYGCGKIDVTFEAGRDIHTNEPFRWFSIDRGL